MKKLVYIFLCVLCLLSADLFANGPVYNFNFYNDSSNNETEEKDTQALPVLQKEEESEPKAFLDQILYPDEKAPTGKDSKKQNLVTSLNKKWSKKDSNALDISYNRIRISDDYFSDSTNTGLGIAYKISLGDNTYLAPQLLFLKSQIDEWSFADESESTTTSYRLGIYQNFSINDRFSVKLGMSAYQMNYLTKHEDDNIYDVADIKSVGADVSLGLNLEFNNMDIYFDLAFGRGKLKETGSEYHYITANKNIYHSSTSTSFGIKFYL